VIGSPIPVKSSQQHRSYLCYIKRQSELLPAIELRDLLANPRSSDFVSLDEVFDVLTGIAQCANVADHYGIDLAIRTLTTTGTFVSFIDQPTLLAKARNMVFVLTAWITMLYSPTTLERPYRLSIDETQSSRLNTQIQDVEEAKHSICEVIQHFGPLLPIKLIEEESDLLAAVEASKAVYVSNLNAKTLWQIGGIAIRWVNNISCHLAYDTQGKCLMVFGLPSYCHIFRSDNTTFAK
jgi:hypothetical protein